MSSTTTKPDDVPTTPEIIHAIAREHRYSVMMLSSLKEQLAEFDIGKTPDYQLMYDVVNYMAGFPKKYNHRLKNKLVNLVINKDPSHAVVLENLLAEREQLATMNTEVIASLKGLLKSSSILQEEHLKIFCNNYVELLDSHIALESTVLISKALELVSSEEFAKFVGKMPAQKSESTTAFEERYQDLAEDLSQRWEDLEEAANDFALAEFVSLGALFESIEPFTLGLAEISAIMKQYSYAVYLNNRECYGSLLSEKQQQNADYIEKPVTCAKKCYDDYVDSMGKIAAILKKTKTQVSEPYTSRKEFFKRGAKSKKSAA